MEQVQRKPWSARRTGAPPLWRQAKRIGAIQLGEDCVRPHNPYWYLKGPSGEPEFLVMRNCSDRIRGNGCKLKEGKFRLGNRKKFFLVRMVRH